MSRARFATEREIRINFEVCLKNAIDVGLWPPTDQGFGNELDKALRQVAKSYPQIDGSLITSAKLALEAQFDGSSAARREDEMADRLARRRAEKG